MKVAALAFAGVTAVSASEVTPIQKVIQLLQGMSAKGKEEKHAEQVQFAAYKQFCEDTSTDKARAIQEAADRIAKLTADINKAEADAKRLAREIASHEADIATFQGDKKAATSVRDLERGDFEKTNVDYSESIDALERAIATLKGKHDGNIAQSLLQVSSLLNTKDQAKLNAFLQQPDANAWEGKSGGVINMLEKLEDKFNDERTALRKAEANSKHAYQMLVQDLDAQVANNQKSVDDKSATKGSRLQAAADAKGNKADTEQTKAEDEKYKQDLDATCSQKASDFESRQQLRADEIVAIEKAVEILSSGAVAGSGEKHLPQLIQKASFIQMSAKTGSLRLHDNQLKALNFLKSQAESLNSRVLMQIASTAGSDPFKKVKKLIQDLIIRLNEEANEEAEHKGWCDTELATNEATRKEKTNKVEELHATKDKLGSQIAKLGEDITDLSNAVAALDKAMAEATTLRNDEKAENTQTIKDGEAGQAATEQAVQVLKEFYAKAGEATALIQQQPESPEIFDSEYKGMQAENGGVVGMLEVIVSDFARLVTDTKASEESAQREYDTFMGDSTQDKAVKNTSIEHKTASKQDKTQELTETEGDLEGNQKELDAALAYFDKLKPSCIDTGVSHEDRVARRQEEIESLQEALKILNGEDA